MPEATPTLKKYFGQISNQVTGAYEIAQQAKKQGIDPLNQVEVKLAKNLNERVEGLISFLTPQIEGAGVPKRIEELKEKYGKKLTIETVFTIAREVAQEKFCKFKTKKEAIETGIRTGFAYFTAGIVSVPLDGFIELNIRKNSDNSEYLEALFGGPIRSAGGTAIIIALLIIDYLRKEFNFSEYKPREKEIKRAITEIDDYHTKAINLQYKPSEEEITHLIKNCPIQIGGDPTEKIEVSNFKDEPRISTNKLRGGVCLVISSLALKAPKAVKLFDILKEFNLNWEWLSDFVKIQKKVKSKQKKINTLEITQDKTYLEDLAAGRPVLSYPLKKGGFRIRYGRTRYSGFSTDAIHPATMILLEKYIAVGTQLKVERPGKSAGITSCETIEGPIVKLKNGTIKQFTTQQEAKDNLKEVEKVLFLGDVLINYGDFLDRGQQLVPAGYCEEWYLEEINSVLLKLTQNNTPEQLQKLTNLDLDKSKNILKEGKPSFSEALTISEKLNVPLSPNHTQYWNMLSSEEFLQLLSYLKTNKKKDNKITLQKTKEVKYLEKVAILFDVIDDEIVFDEEKTKLIENLILEFGEKQIVIEQTTVETINKNCKTKIRDKLGTFMGARMGRPEKSKMRKMKGSPHLLFPVGEEGGRLRSLNKAIEIGIVTASFPIRTCNDCKKETIYDVCETCFKPTQKMHYCGQCGLKYEKTCKHQTSSHYERALNIKEYFETALRNISEKQVPELIKGIRGSIGEKKIPEHITKGILRAKHSVNVNKDGTVRYDMTELPVTHFKPMEIGTSIEKLKQLGYEKDIYGVKITSSDQIIEIFPQDIILPTAESLEKDKSDEVLYRISKFIDDSLIKIYKHKPYYNFKKKEELTGQLIVALAPHTSAGMVGRILGFSKTQALFAHPTFHSALRRDTDGDEAGVLLLMDALLNFSREYLPNTRGARTMDIPLTITHILDPAEVDDMVYRLDVAWKYTKEFYEATTKMKMPYEVKIPTLGEFIGTPNQYQNIGYTKEVENINEANAVSAYKILPSMMEKIEGQMRIAEKLNSVESKDIATLVLEKHLIKDIKGNLRKFATQKYRCSKCNEKYRRPPLIGFCRKCKGSLIFTVSQGSVIKYLEPSIKLSQKYEVDSYTKQTLELLRTRIKGFFGDLEKKQNKLTDFT